MAKGEQLAIIRHDITREVGNQKWPWKANQALGILHEPSGAGGSAVVTDHSKKK